jgi:formate hydrogenlyase subunit 3/multisubunit Na+/H+ antiporter MnhD subunit
MKEIFLPVSAVQETKKRTNPKFGKHYKWQKFVALSVLYSGISIGLGSLIMICANYLLSANSSQINQYGAEMVFIAFALIAAAIHALDRIDNPAKETGN